jgi:hypothetical protein
MLDDLWTCVEGEMDPNEVKNNWLLTKDKNEQIIFHLAAKHVCWKSLNWHERNIALDESKNNCFLDQDVDGGNAFVIWAKNSLRSDFMKSEVPVQLKHYFWKANLFTVEPLE